MNVNGEDIHYKENQKCLKFIEWIFRSQDW
jgi:hypothetical protein